MGCRLGCIILAYFTFCGLLGVASGDFVLLLNLVIFNCVSSNELGE